jgi:ABC-type transport system involved in cytochrome c biogenesis permease subunit
MAASVQPKARTHYQKAVFDLGQHVHLFNRLAGVQTLYLAPPPRAGDEWQMFGEADSQSASAPVNPGVRAFRTLATSYHANRADVFNPAAGDYLAWFASTSPHVWRRVATEVFFNWFQPFYRCMTLYVLVFLLICASWLISPWRATLGRTAFWVLILTLAVHTLGLIARIYIQGRPPVTNLYSSAIFIGWGAVIMCTLIEMLYRNGIGTLAASVVAFPTLVVAHFLAGSGDTMQMLQAVLDTNFWLATHVVVITLGYAATFLAGILATVYIVGGISTRSLGPDARKSMASMTYGVICFALLFSFVGTILGGIWADQSWGRFWGWDPKENGAALIVLWNAIILHARWGGLIRERGMMLLAVFGNIVTAFSWFGTNMLGIGFHSYGFMDSGIFWLGVFVASQLFLIGLGNLPLTAWRSVAYR